MSRGMAGKKFDTVVAGFIPGILLPVVALLVIWMARFEGSLPDFLSSFRNMQMLSKIVSLSALPNLLLFFLFIWTDRNHSARGVILATLVVAAVMLVLKFS